MAYRPISTVGDLDIQDSVTYQRAKKGNSLLDYALTYEKDIEMPDTRSPITIQEMQSRLRLGLDPGRKDRFSLEGSPDLDDDLWDMYMQYGNIRLPQLEEEQVYRDASNKGKAMLDAGLKMPPNTMFGNL